MGVSGPVWGGNNFSLPGNGPIQTPGLSRRLSALGSITLLLQASVAPIRHNQPGSPSLTHGPTKHSPTGPEAAPWLCTLGLASGL